MNYYLEAFKNYANFEGRARRSEYWYFVLFHNIVAIVLGVIGFFIMDSTDSPIGLAPLVIYALATLIPGLALGVRRFHDIGKSGWFILLGFIPYVGGIILLIFFVQDSKIGPNEWGLNPKGVGNNQEIDQIGQE